METLKYATDWAGELLQLQNKKENECFCDLKLVCSDGYILCHKALVPVFRENEQPVDTSWECTEIQMTDWTLKTMSKFILVLYSGEVIVSKEEQHQLKQVFPVFRLSHLKYQLLPQKRTVKTRRSASAGETAAAPSANNPISISLSNNASAHKKIRAWRRIPGTSKEAGEVEYEAVHVFGDGAEMAVPLSEEDEHSAVVSTSVFCFDEEGCNIPPENDNGYFCAPCSMIFCDEMDFMMHSAECPTSLDETLLRTPRAVKIEPEFIKIESNTTTAEEGEEWQPPVIMKSHTDPKIVGAIIVCLVCVEACENASDLILHSDREHEISPEMDYDLGEWKCRRCLCVNSSGQLSVFLQHVVHCKNKNRRKKRTISTVSKEGGENRKGQKNEESSQKKRIKLSFAIPREDSNSSSDGSSSSSTTPTTAIMDSDFKINVDDDSLNATIYRKTEFEQNSNQSDPLLNQEESSNALVLVETLNVAVIQAASIFDSPPSSEDNKESNFRESISSTAKISDNPESELALASEEVSTSPNINPMTHDDPTESEPRPTTEEIFRSPHKGPEEADIIQIIQETEDRHKTLMKLPTFKIPKGKDKRGSENSSKKSSIMNPVTIQHDSGTPPTNTISREAPPNISSRLTKPIIVLQRKNGPSSNGNVSKEKPNKTGNIGREKATTKTKGTGQVCGNLSWLAASPSWACRKCSKCFTTQRLYMHHIC